MAHRIRLVDDNERTRAAIRRLLERHGLRVREAAAGADAGDADEADVVIVEEGAGPGTDALLRPWPLEREVAAYRAAEPELRTEHEGEFVAFFRGRALGFGPTAREAMRTGTEKLGQRVAFFLHRVGDAIPEPEAAPESSRADAPREAVEGS